MSGQVRIDGKMYEVHLEGNHVVVDGRLHKLVQHGSTILFDGYAHHVQIIGDHIIIDNRPFRSERILHDDEASTSPLVKSPLNGRVSRIVCAQGQIVPKGATLVIIEAMKMENHVTAPMTGTVTQIAVHEGESVKAGVVLCRIADNVKGV